MEIGKAEPSDLQLTGDSVAIKSALAENEKQQANQSRRGLKGKAPSIPRRGKLIVVYCFRGSKGSRGSIS